MTTSFWNSWQLWEKLCFVLGCAIVLVVFLGCLKLMYNHWSLRRYIKIDATKAAIKREMQHSQSVKRGRANQVPFGVRALESGVEVDGVWVSRSNTPNDSLPGSPALSGTIFKQTAPQPNSSSGRTSTASDMTHIEVPQSIHGNPETAPPSSASSTARNPFDRPVRTHEPPPTSNHQSRGRPTYQPRRSSGLRFSNSFDPEAFESLSTDATHSVMTQKDGKRPEVREPKHDRGRLSISESASSGNSGHGSSGREPRSETASNGLLYPEYHNPPKHHTFTRHELSDLGPSADSQNPRVDGKGQLHVSNVQHRGFEAVIEGAPRSSYESSNPFATPNGSPKDDGVEKFPADDDITDQHARLMDNNDITYDPVHAQPLQHPDGNRRLRRSQVIRKVNSGFEILRPGTLKAPYQGNDEGKWMQDLGGPNERISRKLHKRGRESSRSSYTLEK